MSFLSNRILAGRILAIAGLTLSPFTTSLGNHYSRTLYFSQFLFLFSFICNTTTDVSFSAHLDYNYLNFMPSFTSLSWGDFSYDFRLPFFGCEEINVLTTSVYFQYLSLLFS